MSKKFLLLFALLLVAIPAFAQDNVITEDNADEIVELVRLGRGQVFTATFSLEGEQVIVGSSIGVWVYNTLELDTETEPTFIASELPVKLMTVSPDASLIAGAQDDVVVMLDATDGSVLATVDTNSYLTALAFSPDGSILATGHSDDSIKLWTLDDIMSGTATATLAGHTNDPRTLAFSPDGSVLASGSDDDTVRLWDVVGGSELIQIAAGVDINVLQFTPDGSLLVTGDDNGIVTVWDAATGEALTKFEEGKHTQAVISIDVSPDGTLVASGSWDDDIRVWDIVAGEQKSIGTGADAEAWIQPEMGDVLSVEFSPDGSILLVAGSEEFVGLYDVEGRDPILTAQGHTDGIEAFAFNPDATLLSFSDSDGDVWIWDVAAAQEITQIPHILDIGSFSSENFTGLVYAPNGEFLVVEGSFGVTLLDPSTGETLSELSAGGLPDSVAVSPDSTLVAYNGSREAYVFKASNGLMVAQMSSHTEWGRTIGFSPDQTMIITSSDDGTLRIWGLPQ